MNEAWTKLKNELEASEKNAEDEFVKTPAKTLSYAQGYLDALRYAVEMMDVMEGNE